MKLLNHSQNSTLKVITSHAFSWIWLVIHAGMRLCSLEYYIAIYFRSHRTTREINTKLTTEWWAIRHDHTYVVYFGMIKRFSKWRLTMLPYLYGAMFTFWFWQPYRSHNALWELVIIIRQQVRNLTSWWRHPVEIFRALLAICAGNSQVTGEFPTQRPVTQSFDNLFHLRLNKWMGKQSFGWRFATPPRPLWRPCNITC